MSTDDPESADALKQFCLADPIFRQRYEGWEEVGRGGANTVVVRTINRADTGEVAVKIVLNLDAELRALFAREATVARSVVSPYVVRTFSSFTSGALSWIEMEFVDGTDLDKELARREKTDQREAEPFEYDDALDIGLCVAQAVEAAHGINILHRDIKPANVLLPSSQSPRAKLTDFSIAKFYDRPKLTKTDLIRGTPISTSPEAAAGKPPTLAHDIYGLGILLFLLFTTRRMPFASLTNDSTTSALLKAHAKERPLSVRYFRKELPQALDDLVASCLEKSPEDRPKIDGVVREMKGLKASSPSPAPGGVAAPGVPPPARRRAPRNGLVVVGAAALGIIGLSTLFLLPRGSSAPGPESTAGTPPAMAPSPAAPAVVVLESGFLTVTAREPLENAVIAIEGSRYHLQALAAGESVWVSAADFVPPLDKPTQGAMAILELGDQRVSVPLDQR